MKVSRMNACLFLKIIWVLYMASCLLVPSFVLAEIFSWTDENGVRHYSDTPPPNATQATVEKEIPHDRARDQKNRQAYQEMLDQSAAEQKEREQRELESRLERTEKQLQAAEKKAEKALEAAEEARAIAEEKQRRRDVYVVPWIGPGQRPPRPVPYRQQQYGTMPP